MAPIMQALCSRLRLSPVLLFQLATMVASSACASGPHDIRSAPTPELFPAKLSAQDAPEQIEFRMLLTAYRGAQGAATDLKRTRAQALERARMLASMAKTGEHFTELVSQYSDSPGAAETLGQVRLRPTQPGSFSQALVAAALALQTGGVSDPVDTPEGFVVIERLKDPPKGPERIKARHILISYLGAPRAVKGVSRSEAEARALAQKIDQQAREPGADWNALAEQYTDEAAGKHTGGDLGSFGRGQMVPSFEAAAFALEVGQISDVVQTPFGFHIIQRYE